MLQYVTVLLKPQELCCCNAGDKAMDDIKRWVTPQHGNAWFPKTTSNVGHSRALVKPIVVVRIYIFVVVE